MVEVDRSPPPPSPTSTAIWIMEIVVGTINKGLVAFDVANSANARILWGTGRGSLQRTGLAPAVTYNNGSLDASAAAASS